MTYRIYNLGRGKFNGSVVGTESDLRKEIKKHLASKFFDIDFGKDGDVGDIGVITVGGFREVGTVRVIAR